MHGYKWPINCTRIVGHRTLTVLQDTLDDPAAVRMSRQRAGLTAECLDDDGTLTRRHVENALLDHVVSYGKRNGLSERP